MYASKHLLCTHADLNFLHCKFCLTKLFIFNCTDLYYEYEDDYDYVYDYDYEDDEGEFCQDHDEMVLLCHGKGCVRAPYHNETCLQCIHQCNGQ